MNNEPIAYHHQQPIELPAPPRTCQYCGIPWRVNRFCSDTCEHAAYAVITIFEPARSLLVEFHPPSRGWKVGDMRGQRVGGYQVDISILRGGLVWRRVGEGRE